MRRPTAIALVLIGLVGSACSTTAQGDGPAPTAAAAPPPTIALDGLPEPLTGSEPDQLPPAASEPTPPATSEPRINTEPGAPSIESGTVGQLVDGNRVLLIGDSILASTAPRFDGVMCAVLNDSFGWSAEIHAETGQHIEFADTVLDDRIGAAGLAGVDVVVMMLGNNYRGDYDAFTEHLEAILTRLAPRPIVLFTLTERHADSARINDYIRWRTYFHPNVIVVDWAALTAAEPAKLLAADRLHLTDEGRGRLALFTAAALGEAPDTIGQPTCVERVR